MPPVTPRRSQPPLRPSPGPPQPPRRRCVPSAATGVAATGREGADPVHSDEQALSAADAAKAAARAAVPGGTVYRVETDSGDATYEAHLTKSDGTSVTVKLDGSFTVTGMQDGMGR